MKVKRLLIIAAALVITCCSAVGCADSSSGSSSKADSSSASSSAADSSSDSSSLDSSSDSSASDSSTQENKPNAIGYDVNSSKRLYDELKEKYTKDGYDMSMKSTANMSSELRLCIKDGKVYSTNKSAYSNKTMVYNSGNTSDIFDHTTQTYTEQAVEDPKALAVKSDLLFGMSGDFIEANIDEENDVINEYYKIKSEVAGSEGVICFTFRGFNGSLAQITIEYANQNFPILFGIDSLKTCDETVFNARERFNYKKQ